MYKPLEWLSETMSRKAPYYPQMGDEIVYFRQGHQLYINAVTTKKLYEITIKDIPWKRIAIKVRITFTFVIMSFLMMMMCFF